MTIFQIINTFKIKPKVSHIFSAYMEWRSRTVKKTRKKKSKPINEVKKRNLDFTWVMDRAGLAVLKMGSSKVVEFGWEDDISAYNYLSPVAILHFFFQMSTPATRYCKCEVQNIHSLLVAIVESTIQGC